MPRVNVKGVGVVAFPDTMSEATIKATAKRMATRYKNAPPEDASHETPPESLGRSATRHLIRGIPAAGMAAGGIVGSAAGPPGAIGGAVAGGYGGKLLEDKLLALLGMEQGQSALARTLGAEPGSVASSTLGAAQEGVVGGVAEGAGLGLARLTGPLSRALYRQALGRGGEAAAEGLAARVPVTPGGLATQSSRVGRLSRADELTKQGRQDLADRLLRGDDMPGAVPLAQAQELETALAKALDRRSSEILPLLTGTGTYLGSHDPASALIAALLTHAAKSPAVTSQAGIALGRPGARAMARRIPNVLVALIEQLMANQPTTRQGEL